MRNESLHFPFFFFLGGGGCWSSKLQILAEVETDSLSKHVFSNLFVCTFLQVLHPQSMRPAREADIPVRVKNSYNPNAPGTLITRARDMSKVCI
jgi:hypothetical protein